MSYVMYNELCEYKDTEGNITHYYCTIRYSPVAVAPSHLARSPLPRCRLVTISPGEFLLIKAWMGNYFIIYFIAPTVVFCLLSILMTGGVTYGDSPHL